jgi:hypothetical protein
MRRGTSAIRAGTPAAVHEKLRWGDRRFGRLRADGAVDRGLLKLRGMRHVLAVS